MRLQIAAVTVAAVLGTGVAAPSSAQPLGQLAQRAEQARKVAKKGTKVYTNADAGNVPAATTVTQPSGAKPATTTPGADSSGQTPAPAAGQAAGATKDQAYWAGRMKELQTQLERDTAFRTALQVQVNSLTTDFVNRDDPAQRAVIEQERNKALAELDRLSKAIETGRKAIADFEDEARRANVPPGWLR